MDLSPLPLSRVPFASLLSSGVFPRGELFRDPAVRPSPGPAVVLSVVDRNAGGSYLFIFPVIGGIAAFVAAESACRRRDGVAFHMVGLIFVARFGALAISLWPYTIPFSISIEEAAAPHSSLAFMFGGEGIFVFPLMLLYTVISYGVFRGKVQPTTDHY